MSDDVIAEFMAWFGKDYRYKALGAETRRVSKEVLGEKANSLMMSFNLNPSFFDEDVENACKALNYLINHLVVIYARQYPVRSLGIAKLSDLWRCLTQFYEKEIQKSLIIELEKDIRHIRERTPNV